jgi:hypothetical protein
MTKRRANLEKAQSKHKPPKVSIVPLDDDEFESFERRLAIESSKLVPGEVRSLGLGYKEKVPSESKMDDIEDEIARRYREGVKIAAYPESTSLISLFEIGNKELPTMMRVQHEKMHYDFYFVQAIFNILLEKDEFPIFAQFNLALQDDVKDVARKTRPLSLFPGRKDIELFQVNFDCAVGVDLGMRISIPTIGGDIIPYTKASADASIKAGLITIPYSFVIRRAALEVLGEGDTMITWRYNLQSELRGANEFKSFLILKIAQEAKFVKMQASLQVTPCKHKWLFFKDALKPRRYETSLPVELELRT